MTNRIKINVLKYLSEEYFKNHGNGVFKIDSLVEDNNPHDEGKILYEHGFIRDPKFELNNSFQGRITMKGIRLANPEWYNEKEIRVISGLGCSNSNADDRYFNGIEVIGMDEIDIPIIKDFYNELEKVGYLEIFHTFNNVLIKLTELGRSYFETNKTDFE